MHIQLSKLTLNNFKGIHSLCIYFDGNTSIFGANEAGKSTLYTAFTWLLTGKDEFDRKDYEIKNTKNKELNTQPHEVEGIFIVDGVELKLKRVFLEKWEKPRGQVKKEFKGHYTDYYVNDVPCKAADYQAEVDRIIDSKIIKLVTNPTYFNSLPWQDQRRGLMAIAGEVTDTEVISAIATPQNDYGTLIMVLNGGKSLEKWKQELAAKKTLLKKAAVEFRPRIDELKRGLPEEKDWELLQSQVKYITGEMEVLDESISDATKALSEKQKGIMAQQKEVFQKQNQLSAIRQRIKSELLSQRGQHEQNLEALKRELQNVASNIERLERTEKQNAENIISYQNQIAVKEEHVARLRSEWDVINAEQFHFDESACECPTCKQPLPADDVDKQRGQLLKNFNESVARRKADRVSQSQLYKNEIAQLKENIEALKSQNHAEQLGIERNHHAALTSRIAQMQEEKATANVPDIDTATETLLKVNGDALNLQDEIAALEKDIADANAGQLTETETTRFKTRRAELQQELDGVKAELAQRDSIAKTNNRIAELEAEEKVNAQAIADLELQEFEVESFSRAKMDIIQKRVNGLFQYVSFRMFEQQVNGAFADTCVCEYNGVPYPTLNTAARLLAGLDVLNTLSRFYQVYAPVFCDNRESVTFIPECRSQVVSLFVSPQDKKLRVEKAGCPVGELALA